MADNRIFQNILQDGRKRILRKGEILFVSGKQAMNFYYVLSGEIRLFKADTEGHEIEVARMGPGNFLGEVILFASETFPVSAEASKASTLLSFSKSWMVSRVNQDPEAALFFLKLLAGKCLILNERLEALGMKSVRERLVKYLLEHSPRSERGTFELKIKKQELAKQLGTISETLSRNFRRLEREGLIKVQGKQIQIKNTSKLHKSLSRGG